MHEKLAMKVPELAKRLGVDRRTVRAAIRRGEFRAFKLGRTHYISVIASLTRLIVTSFRTSCWVT